MNTALAFDIWVKGTLSICITVIIISIFAAVIQWRKRITEDYGVIPGGMTPSSDTIKRHQGKPKAVAMKEYPPAFSGGAMPLMEVSTIWIYETITFVEFLLGYVHTGLALTHGNHFHILCHGGWYGMHNSQQEYRPALQSFDNSDFNILRPG